LPKEGDNVYSILSVRHITLHSKSYEKVGWNFAPSFGDPQSND